MTDKETQIILERFFNECKAFWLKDIRKESIDEREAFRRALEWDMIEIYNFNNGCFNNPYSTIKEPLNNSIVVKFFQTRCQDLYGNDWKSVYESYGLKKGK